MRHERRALRRAAAFARLVFAVFTFLVALAQRERCDADAEAAFAEATTVNDSSATPSSEARKVRTERGMGSASTASAGD